MLRYVRVSVIMLAMNSPLSDLIERVLKTEHGFKDIQNAADDVVKAQSTKDALHIAKGLLEHDLRQPRCLATFILGRCAAQSDEALRLLRTKVSQDADWRVQEILAKAFDQYCSDIGYQTALPVIEDWLADPSPNVRRAVTEGLRIWTGRPWFEEHPDEAVRMLSALRAEESAYLRKSVGNALHDIGKKYPDLIRNELAQWDATNPLIMQTHRLAARSL